MELVDTAQTKEASHREALKDLEKAYQKLGHLISDLKISQGSPSFLEDLEFNLPAVMNYIGSATKKAQLEKPEQLISSLVPTYWRQTLRFPMETHSLEEVWKSVWKCNLSTEELQILQQIELPETEDAPKKKEKKKDKKKDKKKTKPVKKVKTDLDSGDELDDYLVTVDEIVDHVYDNVEEELPFSGSLPGYASDVYTKMDREQLEKYLESFKLDQFNNQIVENKVRFNSLETVNTKKEEYEKILKDAYWQGPFFYGGSSLPGYTYLSFATITKEGQFGGWWLVMWANGTMRLTQNLSVEQVGRIVNIT